MPLTEQQLLKVWNIEKKKDANMRFIFEKKNQILLILAIIVTIAGYVVMGTGDKIISPILLIIAYVVLFPAALLIGWKKSKHD